MSPLQRILISSRYKSKAGFWYRGIEDYRSGFSDGNMNFWIGLDILNKITQTYNYKLRIETMDGFYVEEYAVFKVGSDTQKFLLTVSNPIIFNRNGFANHNNIQFSAHNFGPDTSLAFHSSSGFWFRPTNYFCQTCETSIDQHCTYHRNYQFGGAPGYVNAQEIDLLGFTISRNQIKPNPNR
ncbi:unnamed protein product, partial [Brachionus calyciflorus]